MDITIYTAALSGDMYDTDSWTKVNTGPDLKKILKWANNVIDEFAGDADVPKVEHDYGDKVNGEYTGTVYRKLTASDVMNSKCYCHNLVFEDDNTNRIYAVITETKI